MQQPYNARLGPRARDTTQQDTTTLYLARVRVEPAKVILALRALDLDFIRRLLDKLGHVLLQHVVDNLQEPYAVAQELLADALARGVDGDLEARARVQERGDKQAHGNRLAESPRRRDENLLVDGRPRIHLEQARVRLAKEPRRVRLEQNAHDRVEKALVEEALPLAAMRARLPATAAPLLEHGAQRLPLLQPDEVACPTVQGLGVPWMR